jgi:acetylornithine deacetylase/succinyl-diaminopimelate desuccinylase-like protein
MTLRTLLSAAIVMAGWAGSMSANEADLAVLKDEIARNHPRALARLQDWIRLPAIAAENRGFPEGTEQMAALLREVGFQQVEIMPTKGKPGVFATLDAGAEKTVGIYFMYDVKQYDPAEWTQAPPLEARLVDRPGLGQVMIGRGATNQKGPQAAFLAAVDAFRTSGRKLPVNLVLIAEGEEEIGSPNIGDLVLQPRVLEALSRCVGVFMPHATQGLDGAVTVNLGAKGVIEVELTASGATWGRGPMRDVHSSFKSMVDSPVWRLVTALNTLVTPDGNTPAIDGWFENVRPLNETERALLRNASQRLTERQFKVGAATTRWIDDLPFLEALERYISQPTVNIEGIYGGYTGPGGKTVLPHKASAKLDLRLVPNQTAEEALTKLRAHLAKRGYADIQIDFTGGYSPTTTEADSRLIQTQVAVLERNGINAVLWPRLAGSYPGYIFTDPPVSLPSGHFGLGHGGGAHAPDEYFLIYSTHPVVRGYDGMALSFVEYLYELAK